MGGFLQHGSETEELSRRGFIDHDFLLVLVNGCHPNHARDHDVGPATRIAHLVDSLPGSKLLDLDLAGQNGGFFVVEQGEERNLSQDFWIASHWMSPGTESSPKCTDENCITNLIEAIGRRFPPCSLCPLWLRFGFRLESKFDVHRIRNSPQVPGLLH